MTPTMIWLRAIGGERVTDDLLDRIVEIDWRRRLSKAVTMRRAGRGCA